MPTPLLVLLIAVGALLALCLLNVLLYLFVFLRPRGKAPADKALLCDYAHRGLHGNGVPENSLRAFALAAEAGLGIELDVRLSRDGVVMVYHDDTLERLTVDSRRVSAVSAEELGALTLAGTEETIPTFAAVLRLVNGRVPLLVELKGEDFDTSLCPKVAALLRDYAGSYCIESFNPLLVREMKKHLPAAYCGLLYTNVVRDKKNKSLLNRLLTLMALNFLCRPQFISYNECDRDTLPVKLTTRFYRAQKFVWTVRSRASLDAAHERGECPIFEQIGRE